MIDKYKTPRAHRLTPWRSPATGWAAELLQCDRRRATPSVNIARVARIVLQSIGFEHALESGALPGDCVPRELRVDWG